MTLIPAAVLGLAGEGAAYLDAVRANRRYRLLAVADADPQRVRAAVEATGAKGYTDYRSLVVEQSREDLEAIFVALEPHESLEYVALAAAGAVHVYHQAPPGRRVEEASSAWAALRERDRLLVVARYWSAEPAFDDLHDIESRIGHVHVAAADVRIAAHDLGGWRGDSVRAGGGVLIQGAYQVVDLLVALFGAPDDVSAALSRRRGASSARSYDTEDAAIVSMRFADNRIASVSATRGMRRDSWRIELVGARGEAKIRPDRLCIVDESGTQRRSVVRASNRFAAQIDDFARAIRDPEHPRRSTGNTHRTTLAVIEAAYLSAKTNSPEDPDQFIR